MCSHCDSFPHVVLWQALRSPCLSARSTTRPSSTRSTNTSTSCSPSSCRMRCCLSSTLPRRRTSALSPIATAFSQSPLPHILPSPCLRPSALPPFCRRCTSSHTAAPSPNHSHPLGNREVSHRPHHVSPPSPLGRQEDSHLPHLYVCFVQLMLKACQSTLHDTVSDRCCHSCHSCDSSHSS